MESPSINEWYKEAKKDESSTKCGMYLLHNGVVRELSRKRVRENDLNSPLVKGMSFDFDNEKVDEAIKKTYLMDGIYYIKVWLNKGNLQLGDDIMYVLIGGDIRPHVIEALQSLVGEIKTKCVIEKELY
ncbi:MAG: molybdenum cofactor biosynthesis protein MoaE [Eubacteriales bacterium]|nr:molybdenum cofactor biosynthesis protein MoaE [Eubacteriales bacterium]